MMSNHLVNNLDGIWHPSNFIAGDWEISLGRGLQRYADRARFGLVSSPWNSIIVFALFGTADYFIIKKFRLEKSFFSFLFVFITLANPILSESLSYSYMSVNFALAYFFAVSAFFFSPASCGETNNRVDLIVISSLFFGISMAFYQAYICVYAVLCIFFLIFNAKNCKQLKNILKSSLIYLIVFITGGLLYFIITKLLLIRADVEMASYRGADEVGLLYILRNIPHCIVLSYKESFKYLVKDRLFANIEFSEIMICLVFLVILLSSISAIISLIKHKKSVIMTIVIFLLLIPLAASCICILVPGNGISSLMAMGILVGILLFYTLAEEIKSMRIATNIVFVIMAWYLVSAVENDQIALRESTIATCNMTENALAEMFAEGLYSEAESVAFVGRTADNPLFYRSSAFDMANGYAQFGWWSRTPEDNRSTWIGITETMCGTSLWFCYPYEYSEIVNTDEVKQMPIYPEKGYMKIVNDILVVKMSEIY